METDQMTTDNKEATAARPGKRWPLTPQQMLEDIRTRPTVPLYPHAAWALDLSRRGAYEAARRGDIETIGMGRKRPALTGPLRRQLKIEG
jgi:hypothetical protein